MQNNDESYRFIITESKLVHCLFVHVSKIVEEEEKQVEDNALRYAGGVKMGVE